MKLSKATAVAGTFLEQFRGTSRVKVVTTYLFVELRLVRREPLARKQIACQRSGHEQAGDVLHLRLRGEASTPFAHRLDKRSLA